MAEPAEVKISKAVGEGLIKVQVSKSFGTSEQLNAEMDVPVKGVKEAVNFIYQNAIRPRALSYAQEVVEYQLENDLMAYEVTLHEEIDKHKDDIEGLLTLKRKELEQANGKK